MIHVMLDLETLGLRAGCPVLSIGAVTMDNQALEFYSVAHRNQSDIDLYADLATVAWWTAQSDEAKKVLSTPHTMTIRGLLREFSAWLPNDACVWGNGADFDLPILAEAYVRAGMPVPWKPFNGRCYRTIKNLAPHIKLVRSGTHHNALDDAKSQALHMAEIVKALGLVLG